VMSFNEADQPGGKHTQTSGIILALFAQSIQSQGRACRTGTY
jgi:hypothetical protein